MRSSFLIIIFTITALPFFAEAKGAGAVITEIAASLPSNEEWIEVYNATDVEVDLSAWRFVEGFTAGDPDGIRHKLTAYKGDALLEPGEYAVIANNADLFASKHQNFSGALFDSSWGSLKESGELIQLIDGDGNVVEEFTYPAHDDGILARKDPLRENGSENWEVVFGVGTPGKVNDASSASPVQSDESLFVAPGASSSETTSTSANNENLPIEPPIADAGSDIAAQVGETIVFDGSRSQNFGDGALSYNWDFGDGEKAEGVSVAHAFSKEGDYRARLIVSNNAGDDYDDARVTVAETPGVVSDESETPARAYEAVTPSRDLAIMQGIVTVEPGIFAKTYFYMSSKDGRSAAQVYATDGAFPDLHIGQLIEVSGKMSSYYDVPRIKIDSPEAVLVVEGADPPDPEEVRVSDAGDEHLGRLVSVRGVIIKEDGKIFIDQEGARMRLEIKPETGISKTDVPEGAQMTIFGIVDKTRSGLRLLPRYPGDVRLVKDAVSENQSDAKTGDPRVLGEKADISIPDIEYTPSEGITYTTDQSRSSVLKYLTATAFALGIVLIGLAVQKYGKNRSA
ncbi:MAG: lamin tail domain-containing protein [Candidatus Jacksonbacteria bacterium]|nr:lamin tail domain-containing protein [Candidatus Jacksonbacteria bacterium]